MEVVRDISAARAAVGGARRAGRSIALVPTMGALHVAHVSLIEAARAREGAYVVVSIFVNPTQFGPGEDFAGYPRDERSDLRTCERVGVDLVFFPPVGEMYLVDARTTVHVSHLTETLCGPHRPGHFDGVTTIVAKLFNIVAPDVAYFGEKDAQQLAVIRRMTRDLNLPIEIVGCPTLREPGGLAVSSRNANLSDAERTHATALYRALCEARAEITGGERDPRRISATMRRVLGQSGQLNVDYASVVDSATMQPLRAIDGPVLIAVAARIGSTRLIDNIMVDPGARRE